MFQVEEILVVEPSGWYNMTSGFVQVLFIFTTTPLHDVVHTDMCRSCVESFLSLRGTIQASTRNATPGLRMRTACRHPQSRRLTGLKAEALRLQFGFRASGFRAFGRRKGRFLLRQSLFTVSV